MPVGIPDEEVAQVRAATDIVGLISEHAALKKVGRRWSGLCPFHTEKTPSFSVNAEEGFYYCFGCQESGDAITFVRAMDHLDFVDAVRFLADRAGITLHEDQEMGATTSAGPSCTTPWSVPSSGTTSASCARPTPAPPATTSARAATTVTSCGSSAWGGRPTIGTPWRRHSSFPRTSSPTPASASSTDGRRVQDFFRGPRAVSRSATRPGDRSRSAGASCRPGRARRRPTDPEPKYKNSQESPIYSKRRTLYGLNWAKKGVIAQGEVVVCEGYTDVIGSLQAGVPWAVATCGTALAEEHFTLLRNFAKRIVLAYDADAAGQSATSRVYEWERKHEVDVVVADLPGGSDPGELARPTRPRWPGPSRRPGPSCSSGWTASSRQAISRPPRVGPGRPRRRSRPWPSTPTTWFVTNT